MQKTAYHISANSFRGTILFLNLALCTVTKWKLFKEGNYSRMENICGNTLSVNAGTRCNLGGKIQAFIQPGETVRRTLFTCCLNLQSTVASRSCLRFFEYLETVVKNFLNLG